jgi:uncharacterized protein (TIGR04551 family)
MSIVRRASRDVSKILGLFMPYSGSKLTVGVAFILLGTQVAEAQLGPMGGGPGGGLGGPQQPSGEEKKEGIAEAAPKAPGLLPTTPALPAPKGRRKRWKLLELDGYFRVRTDWFKNFNLGFNDDPALGGAPFPRALGCSSTVLNHPCDDSIGGANMRLRLEPTINLDEGTSVHVQADVLDNIVLGSTPYQANYSGIYTGTASTTGSNKPPLGAFGGTQSPPVQGVNSDRASILVKRAWAEVAVPLGILKAGRMPNHWGMGIWANGGGQDPINGTYDYDGDYGDSVDRVSFSAQIPGTSLRAMIAQDWALTRLASNQTNANRGHEGHPFDLDDSDDATGWVAVLSKMDTPQEFRDAVERGETAANYGVYFEYKTQSWDNDLTGFTVGGPFDATTHYVPRNSKSYTTSLWGKLGLGSITLESELVGQLGTIGTLSDLGINNALSIRKFGGVGRFTWKGVEGKLRLGVESGFATGDQWDNTPQGNTNVAYANLLGGQGATKLTQFIFNREYKVDLIMWRHLFGAVTNAVYAKPFLQYDITKSITFKVANITSFALKPVATPGNSIAYGTEFDSDLGYNAGKLFAGISYGVLFPLGAMAHPADDTTAGGPGYQWGTVGNTNQGDAGTAHTIQMRLVLAF